MGTPDLKQGIRDLISQPGPNGIAPAFLADTGPQYPTIGGKLLYALGLGIDVLIEKTFQGIQARMPTVCDPSALPFIGLDDSIPQGTGEPTSSYRVRLQQTYQSWRKAGTPWGVMMNILPMLLPYTPEIRCVNDSSAWDTYFAGQSTQGPPNHVAPPSTPNWNWDDEADPHPAAPVAEPAWWRWWLIIYATSQAWATPAAVVGSGPVVGNNGKPLGVGFSQPALIFAGLRSVLSSWNKGGKWCRYIIVSFSDSLFDPAQTADGTHNPDGTFGPLAAPSGGVYTPVRFANARYCQGAA
jgi:hypothetical protein